MEQENKEGCVLKAMQKLKIVLLLIAQSRLLSGAVLSLPADTTHRIIVLETTECYGTCPVQKLEIFAGGLVRYQGIKHTKLKGTYALKLRKSDLERLSKRFRTARFFEFKDSYQQKVSDLPTTYLTFSDGGRTKTILDYYGTPEAVKQLERGVLALLERKGWRKIKASREDSRDAFE